MNLKEILKNNGTGILRGLCRPAVHNSFEEAPFMDSSDSEKEPLDVRFSLNDQNLDSFIFFPNGINSGERGCSGTIDLDKEGDKKIWVEIKWDGSGTNPEVADFTAFILRD